MFSYAYDYMFDMLDSTVSYTINQKKVKSSPLFGVVLSTNVYWTSTSFMHKSPFSSMLNQPFFVQMGDGWRDAIPLVSISVLSNGQTRFIVYLYD